MTSPVRKQSAAVEKMAEDWHLLDALMGGTKAMRQAGVRYLPQWPAEDKISYEARLATATLFPAYERTVSVLTGKPFSKELTLSEDTPKKIVEWLENADLQGRTIHAFASDLTQEALAYGLCGILVDHPPNTGSKTKADELKAGVRPYLVQIHHDAVLGWQTKMVGGGHQLTQLRLLETVEVPDDQFTTSVIEQVRVLEPGKWSTWRQMKPNDPDSWFLFEEGTTSIDVIPFVPVYGKRKAFMIGVPPMMELAHANVEHWQSKSDQQTILHVARVPMLFGRMLGDAPMIVGAGALVKSDNPEADLKYVEHTGAAIEAGRLSILDLEDRMRQTGAELLVIKPGNTTEVQTLADNEQGMCDLQRIMQVVESALDQALAFMAMFVREPKGGKATIYRDFGAATLAEASAELLYKMRSTGDLSHATLLSEGKRRGILSPDLDIPKEIAAAKKDKPEAEPVTEQVRA